MLVLGTGGGEVLRLKVEEIRNAASCTPVMSGLECVLFLLGLGFHAHALPPTR